LSISTNPVAKSGFHSNAIDPPLNFFNIKNYITEFNISKIREKKLPGIIIIY